MLAAVCSEDPNSLSTWTGLAALSDVLVYAAIYIPVVFLCSRTQPSRTRMLIILTLLLHPLTLLPSGGVLGTDLVSGALALGVLGALQSGWDLLAVLQLVIGVVYNQNMGYLACPTYALTLLA